MRIPITYWSDYACPFCYIGERALKLAMDELGITDRCDLTMRCFELDPSAPAELMGVTAELMAHKYGQPIEETMRQIRRIDAMGHELGLNMDYEHTQYSSTFDAHRLTKLAQSMGDDALTDALIERLFKGFFEEDLLLADRAVLMRLAAEAGLPEEKVTEVLDSDLFAADVRKDEQDAAKMQVHGVPFFILGNLYIVPGALSVAEMKGVLEQTIKELENGEDAPASEENPEASEEASEGFVCGPDGCE